MSIADAVVLEGGTASFTVTLAPASGRTVTVNYATANVSAVAPGDYTSKAGTVTFVAGDTSETVTVVTASDVIDEGVGETFTVSLSGE